MTSGVVITDAALLDIARQSFRTEPNDEDLRRRHFLVLLGVQMFNGTQDEAEFWRSVGLPHLADVQPQEAA